MPRFPKSIELSTLSGVSGFVVKGGKLGDQSGYSVASLGDFNGDGVGDFVIGAPHADPGSISLAGEGYVIYGAVDLGLSDSFELISLNGTNGFVVEGWEVGGQLGKKVSWLGDVNGDSFTDAIFGAPQVDSEGRVLAGEVYVVFGGADIALSGAVSTLDLDGSNGFVLRGIDSEDDLGTGVSGVGDFNGDGIDDLLVGAAQGDPDGRDRAGEAYLIYGSADLGELGSIDLLNLNGTNGFLIKGKEKTLTGYISLSGIGDFNLDGFADIILSSYLKGYVVWGGIDVALSGSLDVLDLGGSNGVIIDSASATSSFPISSVGVANVTGDSIPSLMVGDSGVMVGGKASVGEVYLFRGGTGVGGSGYLSVLDFDGINGFKMEGSSSFDYSGNDVGCADVNGDGFSDLIISAHQHDSEDRNDAGGAYVVFGEPAIGVSGTIELSSLDGISSFMLKGSSAGDLVGVSVSAIGDVNDDGIEDFAIGAPYADPDGKVNAGSTYVIFGDDGSIIPQLTQNAMTLTEGETILITPFNFNATVAAPYDTTKIAYHFEDVQFGQFERVSEPGKSITGFLQRDISAGDIQFVHDGGEDAPSMNVGAAYKLMIEDAYPTAVAFTKVNDTPQITGIPMTGVAVDTPYLFNFTVTDSDIPPEVVTVGVTADGGSLPTWLTYTDFSNGNYSLSGTPTTSDMTTGMLIDIMAQDDSGAADDTSHQIFNLSVLFPPALQKNVLSIQEGETLLITSSHLNATDVDTPDGSLMFEIQNLQYGDFSLISGGSVANFTQQHVWDSDVQFQHDGGELAPIYDVRVGDGARWSGSQSANVTFTPVNDAPQIIGTPITSVATDAPYLYDFSISDSDIPAQIVSVNVTADGGALPSWLAYADLGGGDHRLSGTPASSDATTGIAMDIMAQDDSGTATDTSHQLFSLGVLYPPELLQNRLTIQEGETVILTSSHLNATDPDTAAGSLTFQISSSARITFERSGGAVTSFTQQQLWDGLMTAIHDGSELVPIYDVQVSDGTGLSALQAADVTFIPVNDPPTLTTRALTIDEDETVVLSSSELYATDPDTADGDLTFLFSGVQYGQFEHVITPGVPIANATQLAIGSSQVQFSHDGGELVPLFDVAVTDGEYTDGPYPATISFSQLNDPPTITVNQLTVNEGQSVVLTTSDLNVTDVDSPAATFTFTVSSVQQGKFERVSVPDTEVFTFTLDEIIAGDIQFIHNGSEVAPSYTVTASDGDDSSAPSVVAMTFLNSEDDPPSLGNNHLVVDEGETVVLTSAHLSAADVDTGDADLTFTVSSVLNGYFERAGAVGVAITTFTQQEIIDGDISFVHDGGEGAPSYQVSVSDGNLTTATVSAAITFNGVNDLPELVTNQLSLDEGGRAVLTSLDLSASDVDDLNSSLIFIVSDVQHGYFERLGAPAAPITIFTQQEIIDGVISFVHDGSIIAPSYKMAVGDGVLSTVPAAAMIDFNFAPIIAINQLIISEDESLTLTPLDLRADDSNTLPENLQITVSSVTHGQFEEVANPEVTVTRFTQAQINAGEIMFVHDGGEAAPSYEVRVSDGTLLVGPEAADITFTNVNDAPILMRPVADIRAEAGKYMEHEIPLDTFEDPEGEVVSLAMRMTSGAPLPKDLTFVSDTGLLSGVIEAPGTYPLQLEAEDPLGLVASDEFKLVAAEKAKDTTAETSDILRNSFLISGGAAVFAGLIGLAFFCVKRRINKRDKEQERRERRTLSSDRFSGHGGALLIGAARKKHREYVEDVVKPLAEVLAKRLKLESYEDLESPQGRKYLKVIERLVARLKEQSVDIEKMDTEQLEGFVPDLVETIQARANGGRALSFWATPRVTLDRIKLALDIIVDDMSQGRVPVTEDDGAGAGAAADTELEAVVSRTERPTDDGFGDDSEMSTERLFDELDDDDLGPSLVV